MTLFAATAGAVIVLPLEPNSGAIERPVEVLDGLPKGKAKIEVVFVLDTTGSMSGLIQAAKEKIWSIASSMAQAEQAPEIRVGLVAYRDRGDDYVTRVSDLSTDLDSMYATLMDYRAQGGGDGPESVNRALHDAVHRISWDQSQDSYKVVFLVGDAPPHMDYQDEPRYPQILAEAASRGILVNAIQAGSAGDTARDWQRIAELGGGEYFRVDPSGDAVAIATPFDKALADLSRVYDETRLYYGDAETLAEKERKLAATKRLHESASVASRARRAAFNASASGEANLLGGNDLVEDIASGRVDIQALDHDQLPEPLQAMSAEERQAVISDTAARRGQLKEQIRQLADKREAYLQSKVEESGGAGTSLDARIYGAVRKQAAPKGLTYETAAPRY
jgi:Mg-chelatase subunit ChlD